MWDTGAVQDTNFKPGSTTATMRYATTTKSLTARLAEIGYTPAVITYLTISHFHWDHVGIRQSFCGVNVACETEGARHHVLRPALAPYRTCELQRAEEQ